MSNWTKSWKAYKLKDNAHTSSLKPPLRSARVKHFTATSFWFHLALLTSPNCPLAKNWEGRESRVRNGGWIGYWSNWRYLLGQTLVLLGECSCTWLLLASCWVAPFSSHRDEWVGVYTQHAGKWSSTNNIARAHFHVASTPPTLHCGGSIPTDLAAPYRGYWCNPSLTRGIQRKWTVPSPPMCGGLTKPLKRVPQPITGEFLLHIICFWRISVYLWLSV